MSSQSRIREAKVPGRGRAALDGEYDEFVTGSWRRLCWTAYLLTGDRQLAEDLAQTALVKTYVVWPKVRRDDAFAYARRVLVNANIDRLRRRHLTEVPGLLRDPSTGPSHEVEDRDHVVRLLARLTALERQVMVLRYYYDLSEADTAAEIDVGVGTVKSTAARARAKLREGVVGSGGRGGPDFMKGVS
jgi:RNA polymerase sigma-70 factor (sigma-E family)